MRHMLSVAQMPGATSAPPPAFVFLMMEPTQLAWYQIFEVYSASSAISLAQIWVWDI